MIDKMRKYINIAILFIFVVSVIYGIVIIVVRNFQGYNEKDYQNITKENIDIYVNDKMLVTDYNIYFSLEQNIINIIKTLNSGEYKKIFNILDDNMKKNIGSNYQEKLTDYYNKNFKYEIGGHLEIIGYVNNDNLYRVYKNSSSIYICKIKTINPGVYTNIAIKILDNNKYLINYLEI